MSVLFYFTNWHAYGSYTPLKYIKMWRKYDVNGKARRWRQSMTLFLAVTSSFSNAFSAARGLRTLPLVPSPTGPHPARGDSGVCMCIHVCLVWSVFPTAFIVPHHLPVCRQLHTDSPAQLDSIWTWRNAHMRSEGSSPIGDRTRVARLAVKCSTDWATPSSLEVGLTSQRILLLR